MSVCCFKSFIEYLSDGTTSPRRRQLMDKVHVYVTVGVQVSENHGEHFGRTDLFRSDVSRSEFVSARAHGAHCDGLRNLKFDISLKLNNIFYHERVLDENNVLENYC